MLTANRFPVDRDGTGRMLSSAFRIFSGDASTARFGSSNGPSQRRRRSPVSDTPPFNRRSINQSEPFKAVLVPDTYSSCLNGTMFGRKVGTTPARIDRRPDNLSGVWAQREHSLEYRCRCSWYRLFLTPRIKTNKAPWADQKGRCGVCRANHVEREHFSLSADQEDTAQKDPRPRGWRILGVPLCSRFIVRVQSECRS